MGDDNRSIRHPGYGVFSAAGLSRLLSQTKGVFAILSAFRGERTSAENKRLNKELQRFLNSKKMGTYWLYGYWIEKDTKTGKKKKIREESFFIPKPKDLERKDFFRTILGILRKYDQEEALVGNGKGKFGILRADASVEKVEKEIDYGMDTIKVTTKNLGDIYSRMRKKHKGTKFVFAGVSQPCSVQAASYTYKRGGILFPITLSEFLVKSHKIIEGDED